MGNSNFDIREWGKYKIIWIDSNRIGKCLNFYRENHLDGIGISPHSGYQQHSLNFLSENTDITGIVLVYSQDINVTALESLTKLRFLTIDGNKQPVDLSLFPDLEELKIDWHKNIHLVSLLHLKRLYLSKYQSKLTSCQELPAFPNLECLEFVRGNLTTLNGVDKLTNLKSIHLSYLTKLSNIDDLRTLPNIEIIELDSCKKVDDYFVFNELKSLKKLLILNGGEIPSIKFIENMPNLEFFSIGSTVVKDGDMSPCLNLKYAGFNDKKHYSHTNKQIKKIISTKDATN